MAMIHQCHNEAMQRDFGDSDVFGTPQSSASVVDATSLSLWPQIPILNQQQPPAPPAPQHNSNGMNHSDLSSLSSYIYPQQFFRGTSANMLQYFSATSIRQYMTSLLGADVPPLPYPLLPPAPAHLNLKCSFEESCAERLQSVPELDYRQLASSSSSAADFSNSENLKEEGSSCFQPDTMVNHNARADCDDVDSIHLRESMDAVSMEAANDEAAHFEFNGGSNCGRRKQSKPLRVDKLADDLLVGKKQQKPDDLQTSLGQAASSPINGCRNSDTPSSASSMTSFTTTHRPQITSLPLTSVSQPNSISSILPPLFHGINPLNQLANFMFFNPYAAAAVAASNGVPAASISMTSSPNPAAVSFMNMSSGGGYPANLNPMFLAPNLATPLTSATTPNSKSTEQAKMFIPNGGSAGGLVNLGNEAYCDICQKTVCNKYFLKQHMINQHGVKDTNYGTSASSNMQQHYSQTPQMSSLALQNISANVPNSFQKAVKKEDDIPVNLCTKEDHAVESDMIGLNLSTKIPSYSFDVKLNVASLSSSDSPTQMLDTPRHVEDIRLMNMMQQVSAQPRQIDPESFCSLCNKEFANKYTLKMHRANIHPEQCSRDYCANVNVCTNGNAGLVGNELTADSMIAMDNFQSSMLAAKMADRVTCDVCNKELCNKYFLKTHKHKVHGVVVDMMNNMTPPNSTNGGYTGTKMLQDSSSSEPNNATTNDNCSTNVIQQQALNMSMLINSKYQQQQQHVSFCTKMERQEDENGNSPFVEQQENYDNQEATNCQQCNKQFCSKHVLKAHNTTSNNIDNKEDIKVTPFVEQHHGMPLASQFLPHTMALSSTNTPLPLQMPFYSLSQQAQQALPSPMVKCITSVAPFQCMPQSNGASLSFMSRTTSSVRWPARSGPQQQRVRCDVCGKEVCNKYFLRNHKFKKHGIPLEASTQSIVRRPTQADPAAALQWQSAWTAAPHSQTQLAPASLEATFTDVIAKSDMPVCPSCGLLCPDRDLLELHMRTEHPIAYRSAAPVPLHQHVNAASPLSEPMEDNVPLNLSLSNGVLMSRTTRSPTAAPPTEPDQPEGAEEEQALLRDSEPPSKQFCPVQPRSIPLTI